VPNFIKVNELLGEIKLGTFNLSQIHDFPESEWHSKRMEYDVLEAWFNGDKLNEKQVQGGRVVEKYPIKINPIRGAVYKHAYALFGETKDDSRPLAPAILHPDDMNLKKEAKAGQDWLNRVWYNNSGRSLMLTNGINSQIYGGCVFKTSFVPEAKFVPSPFRIEAVHPGNFVGIPMSGDQFRLEQAWIVRAISPHEALRLYGMEFPPDELVYYVEYWQPDYYEVTINGQVVPTGTSDPITGANLYYQGDNKFGAVPIWYIPHVRTSNFYGDSLITQNVQGIVEEMNKRVADYGDAVSDDSHRYYVIKNTSGRPDVYELAPGVRVVQLPPNPSITGKEGDPDMSELGAAQASSSMKELNEQLYNQFRREAFIPAVADGEDEGSQRSALTLAMRMWPLWSHTGMERITWGDALSLMDNLLLRMTLSVPEKVRSQWNLPSLPKEVLDMRIERKWAPVLPRDREIFVNEMVNRASGNLGSLEHLLAQFDDIEDPEGEYEAIKAQIKELAEIRADAMPPPAPIGGGSVPGKKPPTKPKSDTKE
jgi:hypothetical protein